MKEKIFNPGNEIYGPNGEVITVELITPEYAKELLKLNTNNRKMKSVTMEKYSRDMANGKWTFNGSTICITEGNILGDGQHRLEACIESGVPFYSIVIKEMKDGAVKNIDNGISRTTADILQLDGFEFSNNLASTAKKVLSMECGKDRIAFSSDEIISEISKSDREEFYSKVGKFAKDIYREYKVIPKSVISATYIKLRLLGHSEELIQDFFDQLSDRKEACGVIRSLRKRVCKVDGRSITVKEKFYLLIRTWNEFAKGNYDSVILRNTSKAVEFI